METLFQHGPVWVSPQWRIAGVGCRKVSMAGQNGSVQKTMVFYLNRVLCSVLISYSVENAFDFAFSLHRSKRVLNSDRWRGGGVSSTCRCWSPQHLQVLESPATAGAGISSTCRCWRLLQVLESPAPAGAGDSSSWKLRHHANDKN